MPTLGGASLCPQSDMLIPLCARLHRNLGVAEHTERLWRGLQLKSSCQNVMVCMILEDKETYYQEHSVCPIIECFTSGFSLLVRNLCFRSIVLKKEEEKMKRDDLCESNTNHCSTIIHHIIYIEGTKSNDVEVRRSNIAQFRKSFKFMKSAEEG